MVTTVDSVLPTIYGKDDLKKVLRNLKKLSDEDQPEGRKKVSATLAWRIASSLMLHNVDAMFIDESPSPIGFNA